MEETLETTFLPLHAHSESDALRTPHGSVALAHTGTDPQKWSPGSPCTFGPVSGVALDGPRYPRYPLRMLDDSDLSLIRSIVREELLAHSPRRRRAAPAPRSPRSAYPHPATGAVARLVEGLPADGHEYRTHELLERYRGQAGALPVTVDVLGRLLARAAGVERRHSDGALWRRSPSGP